MQEVMGLLRGIELAKGVFSIGCEGCNGENSNLFHNIFQISWSSSSCAVFVLNIFQMGINLIIGQCC